MAYTTPLRDVPSFPAAQGKIANPDGTPDRTYATLFSALEDFLRRLKAAVAQVEPPLAMDSVTVAQLPAAASSTGKKYLVTDSNTATFNATVAAGGANIVPVFSNGTNWKVG